MTRPFAPFALGLLLAACGSPPDPATPTPAPPSSTGDAPSVTAPAVDSPPSGAPTASGAPTVNGPPTASAAPAPPPAASPAKRFTWTRVVEAPSASLAVGEKRLAALTVERPGRYGAVMMRDGRTWRELALPAKIQPAEGERDRLRVFFGRDDRPRLMGHRESGAAQAQRYYRWKGNWRDKAGEIGRLDGEPAAALFGILGHADPEVVCKLGDICIIKRITGWTMVPVPAERHEVEIAGGSAFAVAKGSALRIDEKDKAWRPLPGGSSLRAPRALWPFADGSLWVVDGEELAHFDGRQWTTSASAVAGPRRLWGPAPSDVWLVGDGGLAHFDGKSWQLVEAPSKGALADVVGRDDDLYVAGADGVFRGAPIASEAR